MEQGTHSIESGSNSHSGFSLVKGIFLLAIAMLAGFFVAYELMYTAGNFLALDDIIQKGSLNLVQSNNELRRREFDTGVDLFTSQEPHDDAPSGGIPDMTSMDSSPISTAYGEQSQAPVQSTADANLTTIEAVPYTTAVNLTIPGVNSTDVVLTQSNNSMANISSVDDSMNNSTNATIIILTTTTTAIPTTTPKPCFREGYKIRNYCNETPYVNGSYGINVTIENIGHMLFKAEILDRLEDACQPEEWCLGDDWTLVSDDNDYLDFCYVAECLRATTPDECLDEKRRLIISTLSMMCGAISEKFNITEQCNIGLRKMTHVAMATVVRDNDSSKRCDSSDAQVNCSHSCQQLARGLYCMEELCNHEKSMYEEYATWQWFLGSDDVIDTCHITNETTCNFLMSPTQSWLNNLWNNLSKVDVTNVKNPQVMTGIIIASLVVVTGLSLSVWACARKGSVFRRHSRDRIEYTQVQYEEDEFDAA